ncbi:MAG: cysteine--tRNA ligase [Gammaproteobacteria bacterium]
MPLQLYDSYRRALCDFTPLDAGEVRMYACGPTVYDYAHIGNLRTYLFEDVLRRTLEFCGYRVRHVINITDVGHLTSDADTGEDKMERGAARDGAGAWEIARRYTRAFRQDFRALNMRAPAVWCRATEHIAEQISDIAEIERRGYVYRTADGMYFDTSKLATYGHLARLDRAGLAPGARVALGEKRHATDFALWKFSPPGGRRQMEWDSPWGRGFPGWHIECSAMAVKYLGAKFDIHCGGKDHIPVHHANEIAQSEARHGTTLANFWMHGYFLETGQADKPAKMSKSGGGFLRLESLRARGYEAMSYRYLCLTAHYRSDLKFSWESLDAAAVALARLREFAHSWGPGGADDAEDAADAPTLQAFSGAMCADLNTPRALAELWAMTKRTLPAPVKKATLQCMDRVLGLGLGRWRPPDAPDAVAELARLRDAAREKRDWREADRLRDAIREHGFDIEDTPAGGKIARRASARAAPSQRPRETT